VGIDFYHIKIAAIEKKYNQTSFDEKVWTIAFENQDSSKLCNNFKTKLEKWSIRTMYDLEYVNLSPLSI